MCDCCGSATGHLHAQTLLVEGMSCGHCKAAVEKAVGALNGVEKVEVDLENKEVQIEYNADFITLDAIKATIEGEGYTVK